MGGQNSSQSSAHASRKRECSSRWLYSLLASLNRLRSSSSLSFPSWFRSALWNRSSACSSDLGCTV